MHEATISFVYQGNKKWLGGIFYVNHSVALLLVTVFIMAPYSFYVLLKKIFLAILVKFMFNIGSNKNNNIRSFFFISCMTE